MKKIDLQLNKINDLNDKLDEQNEILIDTRE